MKEIAGICKMDESCDKNERSKEYHGYVQRDEEKMMQLHLFDQYRQEQSCGILK